MNIQRYQWHKIRFDVTLREQENDYQGKDKVSLNKYCLLTVID